MKRVIPFLVVMAVMLTAGGAMATTIEYALTNLGSNQYQYNWWVLNNSLGVSLTNFTIYFSDVDVIDGTDLTDPIAPSGWDALVEEPSAPGLGGYYDAAALGSGIAAGASESGFSAKFTFIGTGAPGSQAFEVYDGDWNLLDSGRTQLRGQDPVVPEWGSMFLYAMGLAPLRMLVRRKK